MSQEKKLKIDKDVIRGINSIIEHGCSNPNLYIKTISNRFELDSKKLGKMFKEQYGETIHERINRLRKREAEKLHSKTNLPKWLIAKMTGFSSPNYLSRVINKTEKEDSYLIAKIGREKSQ